MASTTQAVIRLIESHNQPNALGWFRRVERPGFYLQQLPLSEFDFARLMSDFFVTFGIDSQHYLHARYFPAQQTLRVRLADWLRVRPCCPLTLEMLSQAASLKRWPEAFY